MHRMKEIMIANLFTVLFLISEGVMTSELDYLRMLDDSISYRIEFMPYKDASSQENDSIFTVVSADNEKYQCVLPSIAENVRCFTF